jgi:hypothetical protein
LGQFAAFPPLSQPIRLTAPLKGEPLAQYRNCLRNGNFLPAANHGNLTNLAGVCQGRFSVPTKKTEEILHISFYIENHSKKFDFFRMHFLYTVTIIP